jgi:hypothetical protein
MIKAGRFPPHDMYLGPRMPAWFEDTIDRWLDEQVAGRAEGAEEAAASLRAARRPPEGGVPPAPPPTRSERRAVRRAERKRAAAS